MNFSSVQLICITSRHAERAKFWIWQRFIWKFIFCTKLCGQNFVKNQKLIGNRLKTINVLYFIAQTLLGSYTWDIRPENCDKEKLCFWKGVGFQLFSPKIRRRISFVHRKLRHRSITTLPLQLSIRQTNFLNAFVENERQLQQKQRAMGNVKYVPKKFKIFNLLFLYEKWPEKNLAKSTTARRSIEWCSIN